MQGRAGAECFDLSIAKAMPPEVRPPKNRRLSLGQLPVTIT
jgi:hypothetical protein